MVLRCPKHVAIVILNANHVLNVIHIIVKEGVQLAMCRIPICGIPTNHTLGCPTFSIDSLVVG